MPPRIPLTNAINATKASNIAPTLRASCKPEEAPAAAASIILAGFSSSAILSNASF